MKQQSINPQVDDYPTGVCVFKHVCVIVHAWVRGCMRTCVCACVSARAHLSRRAPLWGGDPTIHQENEDVPGEMPPGHCDFVGYAVQC